MFLNVCSHFSLPLPSQNGMTVYNCFGNKMAKGKKPFNIYSTSVYSARYLPTTVLWVLTVDDTKKIDRNWYCYCSSVLQIISLYPSLFL